MSLSSVAISASARAGKKSEKDADIIEFVESSWGLKMTLFPVQRVILKAHYGLELDDVETFQISDWTRTKVETHTEKSYLKKLFDEGRCNIGEVIPGKQRREMILSIGRRSGKCVTGDTLIPTDKGLVRIDSLGDSSLDAPEYQKISVKVVQEGGKTARAAYFYNGGIKPTFKLETESGYTLEGTGNHRIKVLDKNLNISWKYLENIEEGDVACLNHKRSIFTDQYVKLNEYTKDLNPNKRFPEYLTKDWGEMLGILAGDGSWSEENCIVVTVGDNSFKENLVLTMLSLFGKVAEIPQKNKNCSKIAVYDKNFRKFMHNLGWKIKAKYKDKCIPDIVLRSPRDVQCAFVRGLFETDGSVSRDRRDVSFTTKSELLGKQVQTLLLSLGVFSSRKETIRDGKPYYRVRLKKWASYRIFHKDIGFISKEKREKLDSLAKRMTSTPKSNEIGLPPRVSSYLNDYEDLGLRQKSTRLEKIRGIIEEGNISEASVLKLNGILDKDYIFEPIKRVEESENHVFDLNVPDGSMFVGNGFTNHNTTISACIAAYETYKLIKKENPQRFYGLPASNNIQIISVATDKDQAGLLYQEVSGHYRNCFAPETEIITSLGVKTLGELEGQEPTLLTREGAWVKAPVRCFGEQQLYKITLKRQGVIKTIYATKDHKWFARDARKKYRGKGYQEFETQDLRPNKHHLQTTYGQSYKNLITPSPFGVAHGFTFGDGSNSKNPRSVNSVCLFGEKDSALIPYFSMCKRKEIKEGVSFTGTPNFFKKVPDLSECKSYLLGWLIGYFAADGSVSKGQIVMSSAFAENIKAFRDICYLLGIGCYTIREDHRVSNLTGKPHTMYKLCLMRHTLDESFFIIPKHKESFLKHNQVKRDTSSWTVIDVQPTSRFEKVYCATVPVSHSFVLEGNIATSNCAFFGPYTANNTLSYARFQTPADVEKYGRYIEDPSAKATLKVTFRSCVAKGLRGAGNICVILDEVAHFTETGQSGAEEVYNAVVPSTSAYSAKDPEDPTKPIGEVEGRVILISSPLGRQGLFYNLFQIGMRGGAAADNILAVQAPTWEVNPTVPAQEFEKHYLKNAAVFFTEYGGEFTDRTRGWIEKEEDLLACVDPSLSPKRSAPARKPHFVGIDLALVGDGTAIAIGHLEDDMIVLDLVDQIKAGEGIYHDKERLEFDDVADWVLEYSKKFFFTEGIFDQWAGIPFQQALEKRGLKQLTSVNMTKQITSNMFQNFKDMMWDKKLKLYNKKDPYVDGHEPYIAELLELQQTVHSKHLITVEAPQTAGKHDDMSDALVRMIWLASNSIGKTRYFAQGSRGGSHPLAGGKSFATGGRYTGRGGSDSKRIAPKRSRYDLRGSINGRYGKK
jgi:intein/homing endonuclease